MAEAANPETGASQEPPSIEQRMQNFLTQFDEEQTATPETEQPTAPQAEVVAEQPEGQASDELTPEDIPADPVEAQPAVDAFEIVHDGKQRKLSREETIKYAQQGFDYSQKMHAVGEKDRQATERVKRAEEIEQLAPFVAQEYAQVKGFEEQLKQWQGVNWVQLANDQPLEYPKYRAQFDMLQQGYQQAIGQYNDRYGKVVEAKKHLDEQDTREQVEKLRSLIPEWRDNAKFEAGAKEVHAFLVREGLMPKTLALKDAAMVAVAHKAMLYDKLLRAKTDKVRQLRTAPPVTKPGASQGNTAQADRARDLEGRFRKSGDIKDAAQILLNRWK
jgi:hypothetical protein